LAKKVRDSLVRTILDRIFQGNAFRPSANWAARTA